jgi:SpoIID/LytB domain protein
MDHKAEVIGHLNGNFHIDKFGSISGLFSTKSIAGAIILFDHSNDEILRSPSIRLTPQKGSTFSLHNVIIGNRFHWERRENQTFQGDLILQLRNDGTIAVINEILLEDYLKSVISSEMNLSAPIEFLKAHAILSRSWVLAGLDRKKKKEEMYIPTGKIIENEREVIRWYDREDHDRFDICADDHCQRYQGITKIVSGKAEEAVGETYGTVITYQNEICDARYFKACGGITENFRTAWNDIQVPYLTSISDAPVSHRPIITEKEASTWILSKPEAYCNIKDEDFLRIILPDFDHETKNFFRWGVEYSREELEQILHEKSGINFGTLQNIIPLHRGPSGRISRLKIIGSKRSMVVGKELEIRRWLSRSHLYSSAFVVTVEADQFILNGAGWGHGVGLCQIGAAAMAAKGFSAEDILKHYFGGAEIKKIY